MVNPIGDFSDSGKNIPDNKINNFQANNNNHIPSEERLNSSEQVGSTRDTTDRGLALNSDISFNFQKNIRERILDALPEEVDVKVNPENFNPELRQPFGAELLILGERIEPPGDEVLDYVTQWIQDHNNPNRIIAIINKPMAELMMNIDWDDPGTSQMRSLKSQLKIPLFFIFADTENGETTEVVEKLLKAKRPSMNMLDSAKNPIATIRRLVELMDLGYLKDEEGNITDIIGNCYQDPSSEKIQKQAKLVQQYLKDEYILKDNQGQIKPIRLRNIKHDYEFTLTESAIKHRFTEIDRSKNIIIDKPVYRANALFHPMISDLSRQYIDQLNPLDMSKECSREIILSAFPALTSFDNQEDASEMYYCINQRSGTNFDLKDFPDPILNLKHNNF